MARLKPKDRREAILAAALDTFVTRGYYGTAVPEVARKAGVAAGTIYHHFDSKEALVNALFRKWKGEVARFVLSAFPAGAPPREQFAAIWQHMTRFATDHPKAFAFLEFHHHRSYLDAESQAVDAQLKTFAHTFVKAGQDQGVIKPMNTTLLMELVFGAFIGMIRAQWDGAVELSPEDLAAAEAACWDTISLH